jgi:Na+-driven multidrug efflux pump
MYILSITGLINVLLNLVLVIGFHRSVDGVAIATITAQYISAISVLVILFSPKGIYKMKLRKLRLHGKTVLSVIRVGIPCGLNSMLFTVSNVILQTAVNTYEPYLIAGKTAAVDISTLIYQIIGAFYSGSVSFSGQCYGAGKYKRIDQLLVQGTLMCWGFIISIAMVATIFPRQLLSIFNDDPKVIESGVNILRIYCWGYVLYAVAETSLGCLRGMKESAIPSLMNFVGICAPRIIWILFVFPKFQHLYTTDMTFLYLCIPISWILSAVLQLGYYLICRRKLKKRLLKQATMNM